MTNPLTFTRHHADTDARELLIAVYQQVYADRLADPFFSVDRFVDRLHHHTAAPGWEAVIGFDGPTAIGYAYGATRQPGTGYWATLTPAPDAAFAAEDGQRTFVLFELMILPTWRKTGASQAVHDELLAPRREQRVTLAVEHDHPRVRALYHRWGYQIVGQRTPAPDSPIMDIMWRPIHG